MKKIYIGVIAVLIGGVAAINVSINSQRSAGLSAISMANIEVLANESSTSGCPGGTCNAYLDGKKACDVCCSSGFKAHCSVGTSANCVCDPL